MTITLRPFRPADAAGVRAIYAPFVTDTAVTFETDVPDAGAFVTRSQDGPATWLVATEGPDLLGYAYAGPHRVRCAYRFSTETSIYLGPAGRGRGLGRALYGAVLDLAAAQGYVTAFGVVALPNEASVGLHQTLGFVPVGVHRKTGLKHGAWHDVLWLEKILDDHAATERPDPVPLTALDPARVDAVCARHGAALVKSG